MFNKFIRNDLLGLDGLVTQKNPDENVNHLPSAVAQIVPDGIKNATDEIVNDANKRFFDFYFYFEAFIFILYARKC